MNELLDGFLENLKNDCHTTAGSCIRFGTQRTQGCTADTINAFRKGFTVLWFLSGQASMSENGRRYSISDMYCCLCRPDRDWDLNFEDVKNIYVFLTLPYEFYPAVAAMIPDLANFTPVKPVEYSNEFLYTYQELYQKLKVVSAAELYTVWPTLIEYILELTGIYASPVGVERARRMLEDTTSQMTMKQIAEECNINYNTFRKQFTAAFGVTPGQYRISHRIKAAKKDLLLGTPIDEISEKYGFSDVYSFTRRFKAVTGISPGKYRSSVNCYPLMVGWNFGYVGSYAHKKYTNRIKKVGGAYSYSQIVRFPDAGTVISFTDDNRYSSGNMRHASEGAYVFSSWKEENGEWVLDPDGYNASGTKVEYRDIEGARTYTYVTQKPNECLRFCCFRPGQKNELFPDVYPEIMVSKGSPAELVE